MRHVGGVQLVWVEHGAVDDRSFAAPGVGAIFVGAGGDPAASIRLSGITIRRKVIPLWRSAIRHFSDEAAGYACG